MSDANVIRPVPLSLEKEVTADKLADIILNVAEVGKFDVENEVLVDIVDFRTWEGLGVLISVFL